MSLSNDTECMTNNGFFGGLSLMDFWIQAIGIVAMALNIIAFQFKNKRTLLLIICVSSAPFSINMFLLDAITG